MKNFNIMKKLSVITLRVGKKKIVLILLILGLASVLYFQFSKQKQTKGMSETNAVSGPRATAQVNKELSIPLKDEKGKIVSTISYSLQTADIRDEIFIQGQKAVAVKGRTFLIMTIKITNPYDKSIQVNTRDYIRLSMNSNESEWFAPEIHNDPVQISPISTKITRLGFPINSSDKNFKVKMGEIAGEKQSLDLNFK